MEQLATAGKYGRNYLGWCMNNLQNPALRRAAERALTQFGSKTDEAALRKLIAIEPDYQDFTNSEIEREIDGELGRAVEDCEYEQKLDAADDNLRADLLAMGCTAQVVAFVMANRYDPDAIFAQIKFSSIKKQAAFTAAWNKYEDALPMVG